MKEICDENGIAYLTFFVTNASLVTEEMVTKFKDLNPFFQITIDGDRVKHDSVRIWKKDGRGTYTQIIKTIKSLVSSLPYPSESADAVINLRINYDNQTLKNIKSVLDDLQDFSGPMINIHFERVWQTRHLVDDRQGELLLEAIAMFINAGFHVTHGALRRKQIACPSDSESFHIINYDGSIHKCNGRTLSEDTREGVLQSDGVIRWEGYNRQRRLDIVTFDNDTCRECKLLPLCMGPCSQKILEANGFRKDICAKHSIDLSVEDYLATEFSIRYLLSQSQLKS